MNTPTCCVADQESNVTVQSRIDTRIVESKCLRVEIDSVIQKIRASNYTSEERILALRKLQEGVMWLGMDLKALNEQRPTEKRDNPYPDSYNPSNAVVAPTADGLKL